LLTPPEMETNRTTEERRPPHHYQIASIQSAVVAAAAAPNIRFADGFKAQGSTACNIVASTLLHKFLSKSSCSPVNLALIYKSIGSIFDSEQGFFKSELCLIKIDP
jgi:hypothetical protein